MIGLMRLLGGLVTIAALLIGGPYIVMVMGGPGVPAWKIVFTIVFTLPTLAVMALGVWLMRGAGGRIRKDAALPAKGVSGMEHPLDTTSRWVAAFLFVSGGVSMAGVSILAAIALHGMQDRFVMLFEGAPSVAGIAAMAAGALLAAKPHALPVSGPTTAGWLVLLLGVAVAVGSVVVGLDLAQHAGVDHPGSLVPFSSIELWFTGIVGGLGVIAGATLLEIGRRWR